MKFHIKNIHPFNLEIIAEGGQAFRWNRKDSKTYIGVISNYVVEATQEEDQLTIESNIGMDGLDFILDYFDIKRNYKDIEREMIKHEELQPVVKYCSGYRILHQDPWETTVSFIISANNSITNIKRIIENICKNYGKPITYKSKTYYSFPTPDILASLSEEELKQTKCGYRARYIIDTAKIVSEGKTQLNSLYSLPTEEIRKELLKLPGVGNKVADCIILYSFGKFDAFPVDTWIKRVMEQMYFHGKETPINQIQQLAKDKFKEMAGFVQQYLFHYTRTFN